MNRHVHILRGIPGSGKSSYAQKMTEKLEGCEIISADDYFMEDGKYIFDPQKLAKAHATCLLKFLDLVRAPYVSNIIVDNTNLNVEDVAPYVAISEAFNCVVKVIQIHCDPFTAAQRNIHGVPSNRVMGDMLTRFRNTRLPKRWNVIDAR